jgi:hypothetical protein
MSAIDPLKMAQFFALPGAAELVEAFSAIPPGAVRNSVVSHAQVLAQAAGWSPPIPFVVNPEGRIEPPREPKRLTSPFSEGLVSASVEGQIVERILKGEADHVVADDLGIKLGVITQLKRAARLGGVVFPGDGPAKGWKPVQPKGQRTSGKIATERFPVPSPPYWWEDPNSPVWDNGRLLPSYSETGDGTLAAVGPLDYRNYATMTSAAARHGITLRDYIAQRLEIIRRAEAGEMPPKIALDLKLSAYAVYSILAKIGRGAAQHARWASPIYQRGKQAA